MGVGAVVGVITAAAAAASAGTTIYSAHRANEARKTAEQQQRIAQQRADAESARLAQEAEAEAQRLANIEKETKKKALAAQTRLPSTVATSFSGLKTPAQTFKKKLLGQ